MWEIEALLYPLTYILLSLTRGFRLHSALVKALINQLMSFKLQNTSILHLLWMLH